MTRATYPPVADTARVDLLLTTDTGLASVEWEQSLYYRGTPPDRDEGYAATVLDRVQNAWVDNIKGVTNVRSALIGLRYVDLDTTIHPSVERFIDAEDGEIGDLTSAVPLTACAVVRLVGAFGDEPKKSYTRMSGLDETQVSSNYLTVAARDSLEIAWQTFLDDTNAIDAQPVILSVYNPGGAGATRFLDAGVSNVITDIDVRRLLGRAVSRLE